MPPRLLAAARATVLSGAGAPGARLAAWTNRWPLKAIVANRARKQIAAKDPLGHYPAAPAIVTLGTARRRRPARALADRWHHRVRHRPHLLRVFRLQERLKANGRQPGGPARRIHVVGAGVMGGDIAAWCAKGLTVTLQDQDMARIAPAISAPRR